MCNIQTAVYSASVHNDILSMITYFTLVSIKAFKKSGFISTEINRQLEHTKFNTLN